jgi:chromodomain-helicase-DNA-binding protein 7
MRASRKRPSKSYNDDGISDEEIFKPIRKSKGNSENTVKVVESEYVVDKILGRKFVQHEDSDQKDELFLVKWRGMSYLHVSWETRNDIERVDSQGKPKLKRFMQSDLPPAILGENGDNDEEVEYFQSDLVEIQRIIACDTPLCAFSTCTSVEELETLSENCDESEMDVRYLVKWRGLPYNESSWEYWRDISDNTEEAFLFWKRQRPSTRYTKGNSNPLIQDYHRLVTSPNFGHEDEGLQLREYQLEGVNWLLWNWWHKRPCILADEMGLGKTIQTVCFLHQLMNMEKTLLQGPFLIVAPLSLISQWQNELALWSPNMNCIVVHGSNEARDVITQNEFYFQEPYTSKSDIQALKKAGIYKFHVLLTTYEIIIKDIKIFSRINWKTLIIDEAHRLKNCNSRIFEYLVTIPREHCVLLTGTPLQNKTEELWALLHFADKVKFNHQNDFLEKFGDLRDSKDVASLHSLLKPYLLRRIKEDVEKSLPPKEETIIEVCIVYL